MRRKRVTSAVVLLVAGAAMGHRVDAMMAGAPLAPNLVWLCVGGCFAAVGLTLNLRD